VSAVADRGDDELRRWDGLVRLFRAHVPELDRWLNNEREPILSLSDLKFVLTAHLMDDYYAPRSGQAATWAKVFSVLEVVEEAFAVASSDPSRAAAGQLDVFANAGLLCEVGWNRAGVDELLPCMGPLTASALREDLQFHDRVAQDWKGVDVDWSRAGTRFERLDVSPEQILPEGDD
jgi:hypothetical protein